MTAIALPTLPKEAVLQQQLSDPGAVLRPPLGGAEQYVARLGARFSVTVQMPVLDDDSARAWLAAVMKAKAEGKTLTLTWPQPAQASLGTPLVNGASQTGTSLIADGFTAGQVIKPMSFFSFTANSRKYLHVTTAQVTANGSGQATLPIAPMLRFSPADNAALDFVTPTVEGFIDGASAWSLERLKWRAFSFTLTENE